MRASNNEYYVVKFRNNPQDVRILANEYLGTKLGTLLGLPMPEVEIVYVPDPLIAANPGLTIENAALTVPCSSGRQFGSRYADDPHKSHIFDYLPETMLGKVRNLHDFPQILAFDKWTGNSDGRQAVFVKQRHARLYRAIFIDQGYCFNAGEWNFPDGPLRGVYARNSVYASVTGWNAFEPVLSSLEKIELSDIWTIAQEIPGEWYRNDTAGLSRLVESLYQRRALARELITSFRTSSRSPFPNWTKA